MRELPQYFNPRTPRGVRRCPVWPHCRTIDYFNPRTPRGVRRSPVVAAETVIRFQSTHPAWGATSLIVFGGRTYGISIHAPRVGCDTARRQIGVINYIFQSTHPAWGATRFLWVYQIPHAISIHAPRVGCDLRPPVRPSVRRYFNPRTPRGVRRQPKMLFLLTTHFNPRTPRGVRLIQDALVCMKILFQSTHPAWGATNNTDSPFVYLFISIHAPRVGCDKNHPMSSMSRDYFNPRTPRGVRPHRVPYVSILLVISIHAPRVGCDSV